jgi:hypothetical protein
MYLSISKSIRPSFFISYSRKQQAIAEIIMNLLRNDGKNNWYDIEAIAPGEDWRREIFEGISACDELILLLSDSSICSRYVIEECQCAVSMGKLIRPIVVTPLSGKPPKPFDAIQYIDISQHKSTRAIAKELASFFSADTAVSGDPMGRIKLAACRGLWLPFSRELAGPTGTSVASSAAREIERFRDRYSPSSAIWLNGGLMNCVAGNWDKGLKLLRAHAQAATSFAGWYFLSLHVIRRQYVLRLNPDAANEALSAIRNATHCGQNPLSILVATVLEVGAANFGLDHLATGIKRFFELSETVAEEPPEYLRAYWCLKPSWPVLQEYQKPVLDFIRSVA